MKSYFFYTDQLTVGYDGRPLIKEINIQLNKGEILTLIGPNGAAVVDPDKCTDCMACAKACPRHLITEVPVSKKVHVACANQDKGKAAMSVCTHSCIGCGLCQKECKKDAIHVVNGVAVIDYDKCVGCKLCTKVCPRDAILPIATAEEKEKYKAIKKAQAEKAAAAKAAETAGAAQ